MVGAPYPFVFIEIYFCFNMKPRGRKCWFTLGAPESLKAASHFMGASLKALRSFLRNSHAAPNRLLSTQCGHSRFPPEHHFGTVTQENENGPGTMPLGSARMWVRSWFQARDN
jgi:hypothetical protein